jgi:hypothetical protein
MVVGASGFSSLHPKERSLQDQIKPTHETDMCKMWEIFTEMAKKIEQEIKRITYWQQEQ